MSVDYQKENPSRCLFLLFAAGNNLCNRAAVVELLPEGWTPPLSTGWRRRRRSVHFIAQHRPAVISVLTSARLYNINPACCSPRPEVYTPHKKALHVQHAQTTDFYCVKGACCNIEVDLAYNNNNE